MINDLAPPASHDGGSQQDDQPAARTPASYAHNKAKIMARLRRMEGQVRGVQRMAAEDHVRGCVKGAKDIDEIDRFGRSVG